MYDRPETADANDRFWTLVRSHLDKGPRTLTRSADFWAVWQSPDLLLSQTCGMPLRTRLHPDVTLIGTPDYGLEDCPPGYYHSVFLSRKGSNNNNLSDFHGRRFAYNEPLSQSGWAAPMTELSRSGIRPGALLETGGHVHSARAVVEHRADFAALDALTWLQVQRYDSFASDLVEIGRTEPTPTLPFITAKHRDPAPLLAAMELAIEGLATDDRDALYLHGIIDIPMADYLCVPSPEAPWK
ncbi:MAG: phosphate/phosphite/phosphonate ABC transporter substrate-binding protein [Paracoccaceae bacterium]